MKLNGKVAFDMRNVYAKRWGRRRAADRTEWT